MKALVLMLMTVTISFITIDSSYSQYEGDFFGGTYQPAKVASHSGTYDWVYFRCEGCGGLWGYYTKNGKRYQTRCNCRLLAKMKTANTNDCSKYQAEIDSLKKQVKLLQQTTINEMPAPPSNLFSKQNNVPSAKKTKRVPPPEAPKLEELLDNEKAMP